MAGSVIEGPMQVDFVVGAGNAEWAGIVSTEGNQKRTLSGWAWVGKERDGTQVLKELSLNVS